MISGPRARRPGRSGRTTPRSLPCRRRRRRGGSRGERIVPAQEARRDEEPRKPDDDRGGCKERIDAGHGRVLRVETRGVVARGTGHLKVEGAVKSL